MENPKIRFKGFTKDWEQRKFGDVVVRESSVSTSASDIPSVEYEDVVAEEGRLNKDIRLKEAVKSGIIFDGSQVLYGKLRPYLHNWLNPDFNGIAVGDWWVLKPINMDKNFLYHLIQTQQFDNIANQSSGSKMPRADWNLISNSEFMVPFSKEEQCKIGGYFGNLDNLITLHQRKCDQTKNLKKYMLQKMFPQNGAKVPEIRFDGFTYDWEQRKFKELCDMVTVGIANSATHAYSDSGVVMFRNQNIKPNFLDDTDIIHINSEFEVKYKNKRLKKNDLLVARTGYPGTACVVPEKYENSQTFTTLIARPNENVDPYFLCQYLNSDIGIKYFESTQIGGGQKNSGAGILNEMPVILPSTIEEEKQIADYFIQLDNLITLHQRKCDELKKMKKYMLQNMFI